MNAEDSVRVRLGVAVLALRRASLPSCTESSHRVSVARKQGPGMCRCALQQWCWIQGVWSGARPNE